VKDVCGKPAAFIVRDVDGLESWACEAHADGPRWILRTSFTDWFEARGLPVPTDMFRACPELVDERDIN
jgi:hypothetical protein